MWHDEQARGSRIDGRFTVIVSNTLRPYAYEVNNVLALPPGFRYHCRYRHHWVQMDRPAERLPRTNGLFILRSFDDGRLYPLRRIFVDSARMVGDILYVEYLLRDWITLSSSVDKRRRQLDRFNEMVSATLAEPNQPGQDLRQLLFFGPDFCWFLDEEPGPDTPATDEERWGNIVDELRRIPVYHEYDFLKVVQLRDEHRRAVPVVDGEGYRLRPSGTYELEMLQRRHVLENDVNAAPSNRLIRLLLNEQDYRAIEDTFPVASRYDVFRYRFQTTSHHLRKHSFMLLRNEPSTHSRDPDAGGAAPLSTLIPDVLIPTVIDRTRGQLAVLGMRAALALLLFTAYVAPQAVLGPAEAGGVVRLPSGPVLMSSDVANRGLAQLALVLLVLVLTGSFDAGVRAVTARIR
jgi:hypothetical protein